MNSKKILVPLATLVVAGAIAVGSGATFSSTSENTISSVTAGTLTQSNSKDGLAVFNVANIKPGDTVNGTVTIKNTGSLPANFTLTEVSSSNGFSGNNLTLVIKNQATNAEVYNGTFGGLKSAGAKGLGDTWAAGASNTYVFTVKLALDTPNADQGASASATYKWDATQVLAGDTYNQ
ncbi:CalY family protein [Intrasporangium calvum]|uniref:CalY family protein n=1 Tax=Intrasporangium calvum TaxID=53358 RepID=A0ABT5GG40_9MICO|nr:TasA family protein [Intrasporangium calvum]MDC5697176.1 CalY family protein [Intrasporangium calvum]